ncbi:MAG: response regulator [Cyanobacteria bacterium CRU_2_1]|nr:response regulator [Cyanobacteria bacterium RU_5_0]NJR61289.1 response regulator [Cyanobacteria bacterium CRU_2_1]
MYILVIEDTVEDRLLIIRALQRAFPSDLQIEEIVDRNEFEQALEAKRFDAVITDFQLRWSDGLQVLRAVKHRDPYCPVIMFTNTGTQEIAVEAMKEGLDDYILKSAKHYIRLAASVNAALERAETRRRAELLQVRLESLLNQINVGVFRFNRERQLLDSNEAFLQILRISSLDDAQIEPFNILFSDIETLTPGQKQVRELRLDLADGGFVWISVSQMLTIVNQFTVIDGVLEDISGRKRAEELLKRYAARLQTLRELDRSILQARSSAEIAQRGLESMAPLVTCQLLDVLLFDWEQARVSVLAVRSSLDDRSIGFQPGATWSFQDFGEMEQLQQGPVVIEDLSQHPRPNLFLQHLFEQGIRFEMRVPLRAEDQLIGCLNLKSLQPSSLSNEEMEIASEVANQLAIALQQARLREELRRYTEQLEQLVFNRTHQLQDANEALEAFAYSISHDLREPLRGLQGFAEILLEDHAPQLNPDGQMYVTRILATSERMDALLEGLLTYSRLSRADLPLRPLNLSSMVRDVLSQLEPQLQAQHAQVSVEEPLLPVIAHYPTMVQIITNLITNAIKFIDPNRNPQVRIRTEQRQGQVRLWIEDNGIGIAPEHHERIFRVFERLHGEEVYAGTGIGLAIVRKGIERLGGQVGVESILGQGSCFWIELPEAIEFE